MKKTSRSFTVEYKSARRRVERKPQSIWGDLDLKSVARAAQNEGFASPDEQEKAGPPMMPAARQDTWPKPVLTPATPQANNVLATQESDMPDDIETATETDTSIDAPEPAAAPAPPVKQRKQRAKKAVAGVAAASAPDSADASGGRKKRGPRQKAAPAAAVAKSKPVTRPRKTPDAEVTTPAEASDDMAELLKLEEENRSLRKQLSEKLRAENADLRKRLNLS
ncbi:transcriptional regulator [Agrobacterium rubi]|uniref:transcriptional regulator n=1 Tax=Agrobacterium rubi TaxID=28099 RepID=UPI0015728C14|nr:transcriptional regulator [Agrobacterium rubi]NTF10635.1 transcriptional regulator [Agrobacterium rubi]NTF23029.1 transcriptional regulator [Agrobacterium rubi]NTF29960.1 transcriptional regulator [Agrobacterium rubi]